MTNEARELFLADRVRAMAVVALTRRDDLVITDTKASTGIDFHVFVEREEKPMRLGFGVLLRGVYNPVTPAHANAVLKPTLGDFQRMREFTYPVCLLLFTMRENQEFFTWLTEPVVSDTGRKFVHHTAAACVEMSRDLLDDVVERVVGWYDAVEAVPIAE